MHIAFSGAKSDRKRRVSIVPVRLGLHEEVGVLVAGSQRADFPRETEEAPPGCGDKPGRIGCKRLRLFSDKGGSQSSRATSG